MDENNEHRIRRDNEQVLNLAGVVSTQPELGPSIPDGGFGWVVFVGTLFFQALIPCLVVNFGVFLAFAKLENGTTKDKNVWLWDETLIYVPLFFCISRSLFDPLARNLSRSTTAPRLISVVGTCLTCAGLLFMWMGMTGKNDYWLFPPAGILSGFGSTIVLTQCETLLSQYFRLKLPILNQLSQTMATFGFLGAPIILGHHIVNVSVTQILLWYQAIILQGLVVSLLFKKPYYLQSKQRKSYQTVLNSPDEEEDIFSKNSRELQIKRQTSTETHVSKIPIEQPQASTSSNNSELVKVENHFEEKEKKTWEKFDEDEKVSYAKVHEWELFDDDDDDDDDAAKKPNWERFEDGSSSPRIINNLSLAEETQRKKPTPLFADFPVNNNNTYAYDDEILTETTNTNVFAPNRINSDTFTKYLDVLKEFTFYKSLMMMIANTYSYFVFFVMYPTYLYIEADSIKFKHMTEVVGVLSVVNLLFLSVIYCFKIDKNRRAICFWIFYWIGSVGYFMIADYTREYLLLVGGVNVIFSIGALEYTAKPLLRIPTKGGTSPENVLLSVFSSLSLFLFLFMNVSFKTVFRLVAVFHFFTGSLWLANFAYKKLRIR